MKPKKQTKKEREAEAALIEKVRESLKFIDQNSHLLKKLPGYELYDLQSATNTSGYSMVQTCNLADFYKVQEFCNSSGLSLINHNY
jgi:hypothetical protein